MSVDERPLQSLAVVRCSGPDAETFLQGQLTSDITQLLDGHTQLAACVTPQGRVLAVVRLKRSADAVDALLPAALAASLVARLRKFVLRAKVEITELEGWSVMWGTRNPGSEAAVSGESSGLIAFGFPGGRIALARPVAAPLAADPVADSLWQAADIAAGLPQVDSPTTGHFVPQMLNLDLLDAISFTKGCYTGQEIVARTQNLGRIKRRTLRYAVRSADPPEPLSALHDDGAKVGEVLMSARVGGGVELLAVVSLDARDRPLRIATGQTAVPLPMPYLVP